MGLMPNTVLEICADSLDLALAAQRAQAHRIELCSDLSVGGVTPSAGVMQAARAHLRLSIHVLIRPRPGDFAYSAIEFEAMRNDIRVVKQLGIDGIVVGILDSNRQVDVERTRELAQLARPMNVTFHRAFDCVTDPLRSLEDVIAVGADRILTSGNNPTAIDSIPTLTQLVKAAAGRIVIMPGGGVTEDNIAQILHATSAREIHSSVGASRIANGGPDSKPLDPAEYERRVRKLIFLLETLPAHA